MKIFNRKENMINKLRQDYYKNRVNQQAQREKTEHLPNHEDAFVCLNNVQKIYPNGYYSVVDFNLDIKEGEFIVLVGPSGCGKTTTLRMICGLESITAGALYINGVYSNDLEPKDRGISMVFQNYALFPHLTVYDNLAYGLKIKKVLTPILDGNGNQVFGIDQDAIDELVKEKKWYLKHDPSNTDEIAKIDHDIAEYQRNEVPLFANRKLTKKEIEAKINKAASILNLEQLLMRKPSQLSGGQCQRVALGRVIVSDSKLLLMDEPLSNLDAKLRVSMRSEIINLHKTLGATTVYVTHDQVEAMTMADRIVIMDRAHIKQIGTPAEVYDEPNCLFVASFIGSPAMNIFEVSSSCDAVFMGSIKLKEYKGLKEKLDVFYKNMLNDEQNHLSKLPEIFERRLLDDEIMLAKERISVLEKSISSGNYPLKFGVRPEGIALSDGAEALVGKIVSYELLGDMYHITIDIGSEKLLMKLPSTYGFTVGDEIKVSLDGHCYLFDSISGNRIV